MPTHWNPMSFGMSQAIAMNDAQSKTHGGPGRGQGRKRITPGELSIQVLIRVSASQREKLKRLGGAKWVRAQIDQADVAAEGQKQT
jgi:hypothetical protein